MTEPRLSQEQMAEPTFEEIADGMALWQEHKPQTKEDWIAIARRFSEAESAAVQRAEKAEARLENRTALKLGFCDETGELTEAGWAHFRKQTEGTGLVLLSAEEARRMAALEAALREAEIALKEIAGPSPRSTRPNVEQLTDAVKWRQGIARDYLARAAFSPQNPEREKP